MRAFRYQGFRAIGIDHSACRHRAEAITVRIDLACPEGQREARAWRSRPQLKFVAMDPPCGTATRAREKPGPPPPLRSDEHPYGLPGLEGDSLTRVLLCQLHLCVLC